MNRMLVGQKAAHILKQSLVGLGIEIVDGRVTMPLSSVGYYLQAIARRER